MEEAQEAKHFNEVPIVTREGRKYPRTKTQKEQPKPQST
uniref:Uncharacterized protein n=1 Tax=Tetranychus urticae TaxID=32264 RepID=T1JR88_TETUR